MSRLSLEPQEIRRLRELSPEESLKLAFGLTEMADKLADAGERRRAEQDGSS